MPAGVILKRHDARRNEVLSMGSVVPVGRLLVWYYLGAVWYEPEQTMAMNLTGFNYLVEKGGPHALVRHRVAEASWFEAEVGQVLSEGFVHTFNFNQQEPRLNLHREDWRRMWNSPSPPFFGAQVVTLEDMSPKHFRAIYGPIPTYNEWLKRKGRGPKPNVLQMGFDFDTMQRGTGGNATEV